MRKEVLNAVEGDDDEKGDFFKVKGNKREGDGLGDGEKGKELAKKVDEFFGEDEKLDEGIIFIKDYFRNEMWRRWSFWRTRRRLRGKRNMRGCNFRFEENAGDLLWGHSRKVEGSVRKKDNARKLQKEREEERMAQAEEERKQELKRLKNLKKKEMREKIKETAAIGDDGVWLLDVDDLEQEFGPDDCDRKMKKAFGDAYYKADNMDPEFCSDNDEDDGELEKPDFDKEDELLGLPKGWDNLDYAIGDLKTRFKYRPVKAKRFQLTPAEMLTMEDKELNQLVSLKKEWKVNSSMITNMEIFIGETDHKKEKQEESNADASKQSRRSRRLKQQAKYKLSKARLMAYSAYPSESKNKKK